MASELTRVDPGKGETTHVFPWFLPDGRHFLYVRVAREAPEGSGVYLGSLDDRPGAAPPQRLLASGFGAAYVPTKGASTGHVVFLRDATLFAQAFDERALQLRGDPIPLASPVGSFLDGGFFSVSQDDMIAFRPPDKDFRLTWFDRQGTTIGTTGEVGRYSGVALSADDSRVATAREIVGLEHRSGPLDPGDIACDEHAGNLRADARGRARVVRRRPAGSYSRSAATPVTCSSRPSPESRSPACSCRRNWSTIFPRALRPTGGFSFIPPGPWIGGAGTCGCCRSRARASRLHWFTVTSIRTRDNSRRTGGGWPTPPTSRADTKYSCGASWSLPTGCRPIATWLLCRPTAAPRRAGVPTEGAVLHRARRARSWRATVHGGLELSVGVPHMLFRIAGSHGDWDVVSDGSRFLIAIPAGRRRVRPIHHLVEPAGANPDRAVSAGEVPTVAEPFWFPGRWVGGVSLVLAPLVLLAGALLRIQYHFFFPAQLAAARYEPGADDRSLRDVSRRHRSALARRRHAGP